MGTDPFTTFNVHLSWDSKLLFYSRRIIFFSLCGNEFTLILICDLPSTTMRILRGSSFVSRKSLTSFLSCSFSPLLRKPSRLSRDASLEFLTLMMRRSSTSWNNSPFAQTYGSRRVKAVVFPEPAAPNTTASRWCAPSAAVNSDESRLRNENLRLGEIPKKEKESLANQIQYATVQKG